TLFPDHALAPHDRAGTPDETGELPEAAADAVGDEIDHAMLEHQHQLAAIDAEVRGREHARPRRAAGTIARSASDAECPVRPRVHGVESLQLSARAQAARKRQPDAARRLSWPAAGTAETEHGGS